jgi:hypothetical protein
MSFNSVDRIWIIPSDGSCRTVVEVRTDSALRSPEACISRRDNGQLLIYYPDERSSFLCYSCQCIARELEYAQVQKGVAAARALKVEMNSLG